MKTTGIVALSLLGLAVAAPHKHHQQAHKAKRDLVWVTETAEVVETVVQTTTVWVDPEDVPAATTTAEETPEYTPAPEPTTTEAAPTTTEVPSSTSVYTPPAPTTTETPSSTYTPPPAPTTTEAPTSTYVPPAPETTSSSTSSAVVAAETASSDSSSAPAGGEVFSPSRVTYYSPSVGASSCGPTWSDDSNVVALSSGNMKSDLCNKKITIEVDGKTFPAFIGETCPGCPSDGSLDITPTLFTKIMGSTDAGVIKNAKWWYDN